MARSQGVIGSNIHKKSIFYLLCVGHSLSDVAWALPILLLPFIRREFGLTYTQSGLVLTCFTIVLSTFTLIAGHLGDVYNIRKILFFGFLFTVVTYSLLFFARSYLAIIIVLGLTAVAVSVFHPVGTSLVSQGWQKGIYFGFFETMGAVGILIITFLFSPLVSVYTWRLTAVLLTLPSLAIGLTFLIFLRNLPSVYSKSKKRQRKTKPSFFVLFYFARAAQMFGTIGVISFLPIFAVDIAGLSAEKASLFPTFIWVGAIPAILLFGILSDRYSSLKIIFFLTLIIIPVTFAVTLIHIFAPFVTFVLLAILGFFAFGVLAPQDVQLSQISSPSSRGKAFGILWSSYGFIGAFSPLFLGFLAEKWGLISAFRLALLPIGISVVAISILLRSKA